MRKLSLWHRERLNQKGTLHIINNKNAIYKKHLKTQSVQK